MKTESIGTRLDNLFWRIRGRVVCCRLSPMQAARRRLWAAVAASGVASELTIEAETLKVVKG